MGEETSDSGQEERPENKETETQQPQLGETQTLPEPPEAPAPQEEPEPDNKIQGAETPAAAQKDEFSQKPDETKEKPFQDFQKRLPAAERSIAEIKPEDIRVRITGMVLDRDGNRFALDDGTGKTEVTFDGEPKSDFVRVFGRVMSNDSGFEIQGEIVQDMSKIDRNLMAKVRELEQKFFNAGG